MKTAKDLKVGDSVVIFCENGYVEVTTVTKIEGTEDFGFGQYYHISLKNGELLEILSDSNFYYNDWTNYIVEFDLDKALNNLYTQQQNINYNIDMIYRIKRLENV